MDESFTSTVTFEGGPESLRTFPRIRLTLRVAGGEMGGGVICPTAEPHGGSAEMRSQACLRPASCDAKKM